MLRRDDGLIAVANFVYELPPAFRRGDVDGSGEIDVTDATVLAALVLDGRGTLPENRDAMDVNDNGVIDIGDAVALLSFLFEGGAPPAPPFVVAGQDPDNLADGICQ